MAKKVTAILYEAKDGTKHTTEEAADAHDRYCAATAKQQEIEDILRGPIEQHHFRSLSDSIFPYGAWSWEWDDKYKREEFFRELSELIMDNWDDLKKVIEK